jgi:hypothetical protein
MDSLYLLLLFPLLWPLFAKWKWQQTITWGEMGLHMAIPVVVVSIMWALGRMSQTHDVEVFNGQITGKERVHGHYLRPYECNCYYTTDSKGNSTRHCSTCYEDRYTVDWDLKSTLGDIDIEHYDRGSRSVYNSPDPAAYKAAYVGEPCSKQFSFKNYVKGTPDSLFNHNKEVLMKQYATRIPNYPYVHSYYKVQRVVNLGTQISRPESDALNLQLGNVLRYLGAKKQVNVVVILTEIDDPAYKFAVEAKWIGGKKNDVVVFVGLNGREITWADAMTYGLNKGNELFVVKMRDALLDLKSYDNAKVTQAIEYNVLKHYDRVSMSKFEYLKDMIQPPTWLLILAAILSVVGSLGLTWFFHQNDTVGSSYRYRY